MVGSGTGELPDLPRREAEALVEKAYVVCPYSNATHGNLELGPGPPIE
jgi:organic hydroperoxide reductase OsmC/OhrA